MDEKQPPASRAQETLELVRELFAMGATEVEVNGVRVRFGARRPVATEPEPERTPEQIEAAEEADEKAKAAAEEERTYWSA